MGILTANAAATIPSAPSGAYDQYMTDHNTCCKRTVLQDIYRHQPDVSVISRTKALTYTTGDGPTHTDPSEQHEAVHDADKAPSAKSVTRHISSAGSADTHPENMPLLPQVIKRAVHHSHHPKPSDAGPHSHHALEQGTPSDLVREGVSRHPRGLSKFVEHERANVDARRDVEGECV